MEGSNPKRPLVLAIRAGRLEEVKTLLGSSNLTDDEKFRFLYYAITHNQVEVTSYLLNNGFDIFLKESKNLKQLYTVRNFELEMAEILVEKGVDLPYFAESALFKAAAEDGNMKFIKAVACQMKHGHGMLLKQTLTQLASSDLQPQIFYFLLNHGSTNLSIKEFLAIFFLAYNRGFKTAVRLLFTRANDFDLAELLNGTLTETERWLPKTLQVLLEYGSTDLLLVNDPACISLLFETLNHSRPFLKYHKSCAEIVLKHVIKMKVANLYPNNEEYNAKVFKDKKALAEFQERCKAEIAEMRQERIGKSVITFYDILTKDIDQLACLARNESIGLTLKEDDFKEKYPIYSNIIYNQFEKGEIRREMIERVLKIYQSLLSGFSDLPYNLREKIVKLSCNRDLRNLILAAYPDSKLAPLTL